ncbi:MAG: hypothetical protein ABFQ53_00460 [Patescibacteria group bacterium]
MMTVIVFEEVVYKVSFAELSNDFKINEIKDIRFQTDITKKQHPYLFEKISQLAIKKAKSFARANEAK